MEQIISMTRLHSYAPHLQAIPAGDYYHSMRVYQTALLAKREHANAGIVALAALLQHDTTANCRRRRTRI